MDIHPPKIGLSFLRWFCQEELLDAIEGDITELYFRRRKKMKKWKADFLFLWNIFTFFQPFAFKKGNKGQLNSKDMFFHYLKISLRDIRSLKVFSIINLLGLSIGITASIIIGLHAISILTFDRIHENRDNIYLSYKERITPDGTQATYDTWIPMADRLKSTYPSIEKAAMLGTEGVTIIKGEEFIPSELSYTVQDLFDIFTFKFVERKKDDFFPNPSSILLSNSEARRLFGNQSAIGREVQLYLNQDDTTVRYTVSGVYADLPANSSIQPDMLVDISSFSWYDSYKNNWGTSWLSTWIKTDGSVSETELESQFPSLVESIWDKKVRENTQFKLLPLTDNYDTRLGDMDDAWILFFIALGILIIAGINYMNLSTASGSTRKREIGLRKVLGARGTQVSVQFFVESFTYTFISVISALILCYLFIPFVNDYFELELSFSSIFTLEGLGSILVILILFTLFSGSYPAIYLAQFKGVEHSVNRFRGLRDGWVRNGLMLIQFAFAILLITSALLIRNQLVFLTEKNMGFNENKLIFINASSRAFVDREAGAQRLAAYKNTIKSYSFVESVSSSRHVPTNWTGSHTFVRPQGWTGDPLRMRFTMVDGGFFSTFEIPVKKGRDFLTDESGDQRESVILNEAAYKAFGFDTVDIPVIIIGSGQYNVVGTVEDFHYETLRNEVAPTLHFHRTAENPAHRYISVRLKEGASLNDALIKMGDEWNKLGAIEPFDYQFADAAVAEMYQEEQRFLGLVSLFTVISISIALMGLYGLTIFLIDRKKKEISIRKVIGATIPQIISLVYREYTVWVLIAIVLGGTLSVYFYRNWVTDFYYQLPVSSFIVLFSVLLVVAMVAVTAGFHALKAATSNPVRYLREE